ncbi:MAG TPA: hypothetical protein VMN36_05835 [Verrucomicrobiales bacterium]|nr:hypothetical protein [Verrucomicrobiales bacterium]
MKTWKKYLVPSLFAFSGVGLLVPVVGKWLIGGEPLNYTFLAIAFMNLTFAVVFFASALKSGGGLGPPSA